MKRIWPLVIIPCGFFLFILNGMLESNASQGREIFHAILAWASFAMIITGSLVAVFRRNFGVPLRILSALVLLFVIGICFVAYAHGVALRNAALIAGRSTLKSASLDYQERGYVTNYGRSSQVWRSSNVVSIAGTQYACAFVVHSDRFNNEGTLAMTTNGVFIWLDVKRGPKIIDARYRPPFLPPRF
jgi:hypothetical protein